MTNRGLGGKGFTGGAVAAPIWEQFMRKAVAAKPVIDFPRPDTTVSVAIDPETGFLATTGCPVQRHEFYINGTEPTEYCPKHGGGSDSPLSPLLPDADDLDTTGNPDTQKSE